MSGFITNAELRIEAERLVDENERLETENAKLRQLVDYEHTCAVNAGNCFNCPYARVDFEHDSIQGCVMDEMKRLRHELRIEDSHV